MAALSSSSACCRVAAGMSSWVCALRKMHLKRNSPERRVEGRRAGGMDDEDLLMKTAGAQGVSKTSKRPPKKT
eukprot:COSAG02_NODE_6_length_64796_cov_76.792865_17_plen_73_part_00